MLLPPRVREYSASQRSAKDTRLGGPDLNRNLIRCAAHAARLHFDDRLDVVDGGLEDLQRVTAGLLLNRVKRAIANALRRALFSIAHERADEFPHEFVAVPHIRKHFTLIEKSTSWHRSSYRINVSLNHRSDDSIVNPQMLT